MPSGIRVDRGVGVGCGAMIERMISHAVLVPRFQLWTVPAALMCLLIVCGDLR
ncbi:hypothetical protein BJX64DRAFT_262106 [Aspergillus heterothallicus]